jgi:hypothetical protein
LVTTDWHVGSQTAWLYAIVGPLSTACAIGPTHSGDPVERILGSDYAGMIYDGSSPYAKIPKAQHQECLAHHVSSFVTESYRSRNTRFPGPQWTNCNSLGKALSKLLKQSLSDGSQ